MYNYNVRDVKIIDELNEGSHEENISSSNYSYEVGQQQRKDGFTALTNYVNYRMNNMESQLSNLTMMVSDVYSFVTQHDILLCSVGSLLE